MSKGLQWIIGICGVLIAAAVIFGAVAPIFLPRVAAVSGVMPRPGIEGWRGWGMPGPGHMFVNRGWPGGFGLPFLRLGMLVGPLVVFGLLVVGIFWLVSRRPAPAPASPAPAAASMVEPPAPAPMPATTPCAHCGQPLQADWKVCPYCGEKI